MQRFCKACVKSTDQKKTSPPTAADEVPPSKTQVLMRKARRADVRGAGLWPTGVHEHLWNAADEVPPIKTRVLTRKAHGADVYWST